MPKIRRFPKRVCGVLLLALFLTACSPGGLFSGDMMYAPHRAQETDVAVFRSAIGALSEGDSAGRITLTEDELSSLLRAILVRKDNGQNLVRDVQVWLEPDTFYLKVMLREGTFARLPGEVALNLEGSLLAADGRLQYDLKRAGVGAVPIVSPALLNLLESEFSVAVGSLVDRTSPLGVKVDAGTITIDVP